MNTRIKVGALKCHLSNGCGTPTLTCSKGCVPLGNSGQVAVDPTCGFLLEAQRLLATAAARLS